MKASELRDLDDNELRKRVTELSKELFGLRFASAPANPTTPPGWAAPNGTSPVP